MFSSMIASAATLEVLSSGMGESRSGALQVVCFFTVCLAGIGPVNWFKLRSRKLSRLSRVNSRSTGPVNRFHDKERYCREGGRESSANEPERVLFQCPIFWTLAMLGCVMSSGCGRA